MPQRITTDQGRQFESALFCQLSDIAGAVHLRTSAYHPAANGMVERFHRQLKSAIRCHDTQQWVDVLPAILLGFRSALKEDLQATPAELVYGVPLRLPGEFLSPTSGPNPTYFTSQLREHFRGPSPRPAARHGTRHAFIFKNLPSASHVFVRHDASLCALQSPYKGPYKVQQRDSKIIKVRLPNRDVHIAIARLRPAYSISEEPIIPEERSEILIPTTKRQPSTQVLPSTSIPTADGPTPTPAAPGAEYTLPGGRPKRRVRFPKHPLDYHL
ncbi:uncharacterized protein LOC124172105 [Ischnura elegans]|uniref:uncharacterized protein LOC124172105 n=1 Tax=Ischnura elegans TaxID=197161 RepID=UPI001ED8801C|nr:uncharacterized protein LOC124172105 [Ischnura elegans]